jgi:hypothetical protein
MSDTSDPSRLERLIAILLTLLDHRQATIDELRDQLEAADLLMQMDERDEQ